MTKRKNRPYPNGVKRRCVESDQSFGFAMMSFIMAATFAIWAYLIIKFV